MHEETNSPEETRTTIFLVEEDNDARPKLTKTIRQLGYRLLVAADLEDGREWVGSDGHIHADIVLINLVGKTPAEVLSAGRALRDYAKYDGHTPLVVMAEKYDKDVEGTDANAGGNDWILYLGEEPDQLKNFLARLTSKSPE